MWHLLRARLRWGVKMYQDVSRSHASASHTRISGWSFRNPTRIQGGELPSAWDEDGENWHWKIWRELDKTWLQMRSVRSVHCQAWWGIGMDTQYSFGILDHHTKTTGPELWAMWMWGIPFLNPALSPRLDDNYSAFEMDNSSVPGVCAACEMYRKTLQDITSGTNHP